MTDAAKTSAVLPDSEPTADGATKGWLRVAGRAAQLLLAIPLDLFNSPQ
jgi:hypothetical protein